MGKIIRFGISLVLTCLIAFGQTAKKDRKAAWKNIPENIEACMSRLDVIFSDTAKSHFANTEEKNAVSDYNWMQGMAIRNNWKLWKGSSLSKYFNQYQIYHPEEMTFFIFTAYHRKLNGKPIDFDGQLQEHFALVERLKTNPPKRTDNFKVGDTVFTHRFNSAGIIKDMLGKQPGYEIQAIVGAIDTTAQKFQLTVLEIRRTDTKDKEEVNQYKLDKQLLSKGTVFWADVLWWRKRDQVIQIHIE